MRIAKLFFFIQHTKPIIRKNKWGILAIALLFFFSHFYLANQEKKYQVIETKLVQNKKIMVLNLAEIKAQMFLEKFKNINPLNLEKNKQWIIKNTRGETKLKIKEKLNGEYYILTKANNIIRNNLFQSIQCKNIKDLIYSCDIKGMEYNYQKLGVSTFEFIINLRMAHDNKSILGFSLIDYNIPHLKKIK